MIASSGPPFSRSAYQTSIFCFAKALAARLFSHLQGQRSAAALAFRKRDVIAETVEKPDGSVVQPGAQNPLNAPAQENDAAAPRPFGFHRLRRGVDPDLERAFRREFQDRLEKLRS